jgi:hypothetical protein
LRHSVAVAPANTADCKVLGQLLLLAGMAQAFFRPAQACINIGVTPGRI